MNIKAVLPDKNVCIKKYEKLYKHEDAVKEAEKDYRIILKSYALTTSLFFITLCVMLRRMIRQNDNLSDMAATAMLFSGVFLLVYISRYSRSENHVKKQRASIIDDFPGFIDKVVLLLNAGMITESALIKIAEDYKKSFVSAERRALYDGLTDIVSRTKESNSSLTAELTKYAYRSGVRELMRFSTIVEDNCIKGSDLVDKLEGEGALLWMDRKKRAEEKAKLAETKLSFPLMLLLLALMLITTAPMLLSI